MTRPVRYLLIALLLICAWITPKLIGNVERAYWKAEYQRRIDNKEYKLINIKYYKDGWIVREIKWKKE